MLPSLNVIYNQTKQGWKIPSLFYCLINTSLSLSKSTANSYLPSSFCGYSLRLLSYQQRCLCALLDFFFFWGTWSKKLVIYLRAYSGLTSPKNSIELLLLLCQWILVFHLAEVIGKSLCISFGGPSPSIKIAALVVLQVLFGRPWLLILDKLHCPLEQRPLGTSSTRSADSKKGKLRV